MALSQVELEALRDKIMRQMAAPDTTQAGDMMLKNRPNSDLQKALNRVDQELAVYGVDASRSRVYRLRRGAE
jgi:hypothetical protein